MIKIIDKEREDDLFRWWGWESEDSDTWAWREDLTPEETALVEQWDRAYCSGVHQMCEKILEMEGAEP